MNGAPVNQWNGQIVNKTSYKQQLLALMEPLKLGGSNACPQIGMEYDWHGEPSANNGHRSVGRFSVDFQIEQPACFHMGFVSGTWIKK